MSNEDQRLAAQLAGNVQSFADGKTFTEAADEVYAFLTKGQERTTRINVNQSFSSAGPEPEAKETWRAATAASPNSPTAPKELPLNELLDLLEKQVDKRLTNTVYRQGAKSALGHLRTLLK